jgi:hypothetical protein
MFKKISPKQYLSTMMALWSLCGVLYLVFELKSIKTKVNRIDDLLSQNVVLLEDVDNLKRFDDSTLGNRNQLDAQTPKSVTSLKKPEPKDPATRAEPINRID